ncbi:lysylphosphatidylglycerol synthase domain-containing protein [Pantoea sp. BAV 3049]|uniref:lysylphosphatidylglycerol synthase domain-containing protein n=1 Tax=Pantoea sp. BAV 3049 TaxID=2654188 RepID=UPI00131E0D5D|nr:lysylphosphatidylglycerol synthase domain-containing protein [Pantoea sp. BAV 3049]
MPPKIRDVKPYLHYVGSFLAICGVVFVILKLNQYWHSVKLSDLGIATWLTILALSFCYGAANIFLVMAWRSILKFYHIPTKLNWTIYAYGISQLGKYVPGNIFHIAGRQAIAMAADLPGKPILKSNIAELVMISCTGCLAGWLVLNLIFPAFPLLAGLLLLVISVIAVLFLLMRLFNSNISRAMLFQMLFLISSAVIFTLILNQLHQAGTFNFPVMLSVGGVYTIAWLAGLVMPGAPAGIGIRELVVVFFLSRQIPDAELLLAVLLGRIVTVVGDVLFFIFSYIMGKKLNNMSELTCDE